MKNKQLTINFIANIISFAISAGFTFLITPYLVREVGSEAYGFIPLANNMANYVIIFTYSLNTIANRYISIEINSNNNKQAMIYFNSVLRANTIIALALVIPSILTTLHINKILNVPNDILNDVQLTFIFVFINMIIALLGNIFSVATFSKNRLELASFRTIEGNLIKFIFTLGLFALFSPKIYFITLTSIVATLYTITTNIYYSKKLLPEMRISLKIFDLKAIGKLISSGLWNTLNQLSVIILTSLDLMIANILIGASPAGKYSLAKTVPLFIQSFIGSISSVFVPQFTILYAQNKKEDLLKNINLSIKVVGFIVTIPISFLIIFGDTFFSLWLPGEDIGLLFLLSNLSVIPMIVAGSTNPIYDIYTVTDKLKIPAIVLFITGITNTIVILILLKTTALGIIAIPLVSLIVGLLRNLIFAPLYAAHCLKIEWWSFYGSIFKGIACSIVIMLFCALCKFVYPVNSWFGLISIALACSFAALVTNSFIMFSKEERKGVLDSLKSRS